MARARKPRLSNVFVWIILGLLIVGLMGFGIGNFSGTTNRLGSVGSAEIMINRYIQAYQNVSQNLTRTYPWLTGTEELANLATRQALGTVTHTAALANEANRVGLSVGDESVLEVIRTFPPFLDPQGDFSEDFYRFYLTQNGLTSAEFDALFRQQETLQLLDAVLSQGFAPRESWLNSVVAYELETRDVSWAEITDTLVDADRLTASPSELRAYYDENPDEFTIPSRRNVTYAWITPAMISEPDGVAEVDVQSLYDGRIDEYRVPEKRVVARMAFPTLEEARAASDRIAGDTVTFDSVAEERGIVLADIQLGPVEREALVGPAAEAVFGVDGIGVVGPVDSQVGPALFNVTGILNPVERALEDVREVLVAEIALERAVSAIADQLEEFNDLLAEGVSLEELVETTPMQLASLSYDDGSDAEILASTAFRNAAASITESDYPEIIPLEAGGAFAIRLDGISDERLQDYEEALPGVESAWRAAAIRDRMLEVAARIAESLSGPTAFADAGLESVETGEGITRGRPLPEAPEELVIRSFARGEGEAGVAADDDQVVVFRVEAIHPAETAETTSNYRTLLGSEFSRLVGNDVMTHYSRHIVDNSDIDIDQVVLNSVIAQLRSQYVPAP